MPTFADRVDRHYRNLVRQQIGNDDVAELAATLPAGPRDILPTAIDPALQAAAARLARERGIERDVLLTGG